MGEIVISGTFNAMQAFYRTMQHRLARYFQSIAVQISKCRWLDRSTSSQQKNRRLFLCCTVPTETKSKILHCVM